MAILKDVNKDLTLAEAKHWVFESSRMKATQGAAHIYDVVVANEDVDNGVALEVGGYDLTDDGLQVRTATVAASGKKIAVAGSVANIRDAYSTQSAQPYNFTNVKGSVIRAYEVVAEDIFGVSKEAVTGEVAVGATVVWDGTNKKYKVGTASTGFVGRIHSIQTGTYFDLVRIECIQNA